MHLLNLTLQPATAVSGATVGSFSGAKGQEILVVRGGTRLEMLKLNTSSGQCESNISLGTARWIWTMGGRIPEDRVCASRALADLYSGHLVYD